MKAKRAQLIFAFLTVVLSFVPMACSGRPSAGANSAPSLNRIVLDVPTMWCESCRFRVEVMYLILPLLYRMG